MEEKGFLVDLRGILISKPDLAEICGYSTRNIQNLFSTCKHTTPAQVLTLISGIYIPETGTNGLGFTLYLVSDALIILKRRAKTHASLKMRSKLQTSYDKLYYLYNKANKDHQLMIKGLLNG